MLAIRHLHDVQMFAMTQARKQLQQPNARAAAPHMLQRPSGTGKLTSSEWARLQVCMGVGGCGWVGVSVWVWVWVWVWV